MSIVTSVHAAICPCELEASRFLFSAMEVLETSQIMPYSGQVRPAQTVIEAFRVLFGLRTRHPRPPGLSKASGDRLGSAGTSVRCRIYQHASRSGPSMPSRCRRIATPPRTSAQKGSNIMRSATASMLANFVLLSIGGRCLPLFDLFELCEFTRARHAAQKERIVETVFIV